MDYVLLQSDGDTRAIDRLQRCIDNYGVIYLLQQLVTRFGQLPEPEAVERLREEASIPVDCNEGVKNTLLRYIREFKQLHALVEEQLAEL
jgi:hypothetical protein